MTEPETSSLVRRTAHQLRLLIAKSKPGKLLGLEQHLQKELGVSRPTLRQAAALVAEEQLLVVRRGGRGGYFARIPTSRAVAHTAAIFLEARRVGLEEIIQAIEPTSVELARLAARRRGGAGAQALRHFLEETQRRDIEKLTYVDFLREQQEFNRIMEALSGNRVLTLFLEILNNFLTLRSSEVGNWFNDRKRASGYLSLRTRISEAVLDGDEELAVLLTGRCTRQVTAWMMRRLVMRKRHRSASPAANLGRSMHNAAAKKAHRTAI